MNLSFGVLVFVGLCAILFLLPFVSYLVAKFAQMGRLAGTRSFISFRTKEKRHGDAE